MTRRAYVPALDGLRALAVLAVVVVHAWTNALRGGWVGVDVFFVLSGYLITSILLDEHARTGTVSLLRFYRRRALRLLPAAAAAIVLALVLAALTRPGLVASTDHEAVAAALYVANWQLVTSRAPTGLLSHMWSLSVEEQFYLAWPVLLLLLLRLGGRRAALAGALAGVAIIAVDRLTVTGVQAAFRTDTRGDSLLVGCALALLVAEGVVERIPPVVVKWWGLGGLAVVAIVANVNVLPVGYTLVALASAGLITTVAVRPTPLARPLASAPLVWLGRRSYGAYLYHYPIYVALVEPRLGTGPAALAVTVALTLVAVAASYRYLEQPFLRLKDRRAAAPTEVVAVAA